MTEWIYCFNLFFMRVCVFLCVPMWSVYLGSKSPAAGNVAVCQDLLIGVWGRDYEGWETYIHTKQDEGESTERRSPFTNSGRLLLPSPLLFCSPAPFGERFSSRVPRRTMRAYVFFLCFFFFASVAPLGTERQPPCHCHHPGGGGAMLCQSSCAGPHTSFLLISPSPQPVL